MDAILIMPDDLSQSPAGWPLIGRFAPKHKLAVSGGAAYEAETGVSLATFPIMPKAVSWLLL